MIQRLHPDGIKKIAVLRALQLGDLLCAVPAFRALRAAFPQAEITLLGLPWAREFVKRFSGYFNHFVHFPGYEGLPEQPYDVQSFHDFSQWMKQESFDLFLQMQGNGTIVNRFIGHLGARQIAGFHNDLSRMTGPLFMEYPEQEPEPKRHLMLMEFLGIPAQGIDLEFPVRPEDEAELAALTLPVLPHTYVVVHPGSRGEHRRWPPLFFASLADHCIEQGFTVVVTGTADEIDITREVLKSMKHPAIDLTGKTSLGAVAALIRDAAALIANCTGVSHIAAATRTPSLIISMDGEPHRWGPINRERHRVVDWLSTPRLELVFRELEQVLQQRGRQTG